MRGRFLEDLNAHSTDDRSSRFRPRRRRARLARSRSIRAARREQAVKAAWAESFGTFRGDHGEVPGALHERRRARPRGICPQPRHRASPARRAAAGGRAGPAEENGIGCRPRATRKMGGPRSREARGPAGRSARRGRRVSHLACGHPRRRREEPSHRPRPGLGRGSLEAPRGARAQRPRTHAARAGPRRTSRGEGGGEGCARRRVSSRRVRAHGRPSRPARSREPGRRDRRDASRARGGATDSGRCRRLARTPEGARPARGPAHGHAPWRVGRVRGGEGASGRGSAPARSPGVSRRSSAHGASGSRPPDTSTPRGP